ncbi:hypothetical protein Tco_0159799, partial [Tanacetum coccineum]
MSKKKAPTQAVTSKGIDLLSEAALLKEAQLKKGLKSSKRETSIHQARSSSEGDDFESEAPDEPKGKSIDTTDDERTNSDNQETNDGKEKIEDEFMHTPPNYIPTDNETNDKSNDVDEEEYERIDKELYGDVSVSLRDLECEGER